MKTICSITTAIIVVICLWFGVDTLKTKTTSSVSPTRGGSYLIAGYNAPSSIKSQADYICDGEADNIQIQSIIDNIDNGSIHLVGSFIVNSHIVPKANIRISGDAPGATLGGTSIALADGANDSIFIDNPAESSSYFILENLRLEGNKKKQSGESYGIYLSGYRNSIFKNLRINNFLSGGIKLDDGNKQGWQHYLENVYTNSNSGTGIYIANDGTSGVNLYAVNNFPWGVFIGDIDITLTRVEAEGNSGEGICISGNSRGVCLFNPSAINNDSGIIINASGNTVNRAGASIIGGEIRDNNVHGIIIRSSATKITSKVRVIGAHIYSNQGAGITEDNCGAGIPEYNIYSSNILHDNGTSMNILSQTNIIEDNIIIE